MSESPSYRVFCPHCDARQRLLTVACPLKKRRKCSACGKCYAINSWFVRELWSSAFMLWAIILTLLTGLILLLRNPPGVGQTLAALFFAIPMGCLAMGLAGAVVGNYVGRFWADTMLPTGREPSDHPPARYEPLE